MAARNLKRNIAHFTPAPIVIFGKGTGAAAADLTALVSAGAIASIAYTATGRYTITLADKYNSLLWVAGCVIDATTPDDWEVCVVSETVSSTKTILIAVFKGGTLTDLTTDEKLLLNIVCSNSARDL
jgi:hypothetical protein